MQQTIMTRHIFSEIAHINKRLWYAIIWVMFPRSMSFEDRLVSVGVILGKTYHWSSCKKVVPLRLTHHHIGQARNEACTGRGFGNTPVHYNCSEFSSIIRSHSNKCGKLSILRGYVTQTNHNSQRNSPWFHTGCLCESKTALQWIVWYW